MQRYRNLLLLFVAAGIYPLLAQENYKKVGYASFYHDKFEGRKTSSGEKFRQEKMTCAHRTLPFGTKLRVTNLANNKEVIVTVNDRGPYSKGRIIDLSREAARKLDFIRSGHTRVAIEVITDTVPVPVVDTIKTYTLFDSKEQGPHGFSIQVGSFSKKENMERITARMKRELDKEVYVYLKGEESNKTYRVTVGTFESRNEAFGYLVKILPRYPGAFIIKLKQAD